MAEPNAAGACEGDRKKTPGVLEGSIRLPTLQTLLIADNLRVPPRICLFGWTPARILRVVVFERPRFLTSTWRTLI